MAGDPSAEEHRAWAKDNEAFFDAIDGVKSRFPPWAMTAIYYIAVHEVQAFLVDRNLRPKNHEERNKLLRTQYGTSIWPSYDGLYQRSRDARYKCVTHSERQLNEGLLLLAGVRAGIEEEQSSS